MNKFYYTYTLFSDISSHRSQHGYRFEPDGMLSNCTLHVPFPFIYIPWKGFIVKDNQKKNTFLTNLAEKRPLNRRSIL